MMQHGAGLAASPPGRNNLEVGRRGILFLRFSVVGGQSLYEAAVRVLLFEQKRSAGSHPLVKKQTLPQTTAPNHCYGYRCTIPRRSVPIRSPSVVSEATTEEKLVAGFGVWRSLLILRLEGSRPAVRADAVAMGFQ